MKTLRFMKRADKDKNRIIIPKIIIDKYGRDFILEANVDNGNIIIMPIKKKGE